MVGLISPPGHDWAAPTQLVVCNRLGQKKTSSYHRGAECDEWLNQASRPLSFHTLLFQPPDICFFLGIQEIISAL